MPKIQLSILVNEINSNQFFLKIFLKSKGQHYNKSDKIIWLIFLFFQNQ